jgi:hypothetical protein
MAVLETKYEIVKVCLEASFQDVRPDRSHERFVFKDGQHSSELIFNRAFLDDISEEDLRIRMSKDIVPTLKVHPGKRISVSRAGMGIGPRDST